MSDQQPGAAVDAVLALLVKAVNRGETSDLGISLVVGGSWLTGSMIGGRMWFDQLGQVVDSQAGGEGGSLFRQIGQSAYPSESERLAAERPAEEPEPSFMHLRNARLLTGSAVRVPETGGLVRLRLSSIQGWLIGILDPRLHRPPPA
ncbi:MAG: hypothetical protein M3N98_09840 [Actinomycetota bacterium]|nr:hypothetical protein [Actinomycetota bacterium]